MTDTSLVEPQQVSIEQLTKTNADLAAQVSLQTNVCAYFKKVHADAIAALREGDKKIETISESVMVMAERCAAKTKRIAELEAELAEAKIKASWATYD